MKEEEEGSPQKIHLWNETKSKWGKCFKKCEKTEKALYDVWKRWKMHYTYDRWRPLDTRYSKGRHQYTWRDELMAFGESMWPHMTQDSNAQSLAAPMLWPSSCSGQNEAVIMIISITKTIKRKEGLNEFIFRNVTYFCFKG